MSGTGFSIACLAAIGIGILFLRFGTVEPCGIIRQEVREHAVRESGAGAAIVGVIPDSVIDALIEVTYGRLSAGRCLALLIGGIAKPQPSDRQSTPNIPPPRGPSSVAPAPEQYSALPPTSVPAQNSNEPDEARVASFLNDLDNILIGMSRFDTIVSETINKVVAAEGQYRSITSKIQQYLLRERTLMGVADYRASVQRSQISVAITQNVIAADQLHIQLEPIDLDFQTKATPFKKNVLLAGQRCSDLLQLDRDRLPRTYDRLQGLCDRRSAQFVNFIKHYEELSAALSHIESVYRDESAKQRRLERIATQIQ